MVGNVQAPWDVHPSSTLCGQWLKALRGRSGAAGWKPLPTLTKDVNRPSGRASGSCGYPQRRYFESICFEHARQAANAVFACKGETHAEGRQGRRSATDAVHDQADHRYGRDEAGRDAWRRCRRQARRHFRHDGKGGGLCVRSRASTGHHGTPSRPSGFPTFKAQSQDTLPRTALQQSRSIQAQGLACTFRGESHSGAHLAH